jgi:hypothetical protein
MAELAKKLVVGETYFFQTCKFDWVGRLVSIDGPYTATLEDASWVANSGRLNEFVKKGKAENMEIEPVGLVSCQWVNWIPWPHKLFKEPI